MKLPVLTHALSKAINHVLHPVFHCCCCRHLQLAKWNRCNQYKTTVPAGLLMQGAALMDGGSAGSTMAEPLFPLVGYDVKQQCKGAGAAVDPTQVKPGTCQYSANKDGTFTYWEKQPGDWARLSNCYW